MPAVEHMSKVVERVACSIITVSDTHTIETGLSGRLIRELLEPVGHRVHSREIIPDWRDRVRDRVKELRADRRCQVAVLTSATDLSAQDTTY